MPKKDLLILITGGHATPAIAVISELKKRGYSNFLWVGQKYTQQGSSETSAEYQLVNEMDINFINLTTGKLDRKWTISTFLKSIANLLKIFYGLFQSLFIILKYRPKLILSFGGFISVPIVIIGRLLGSKVVTHEQTLVIGLANKINAKFANKVCVSWEVNKKQFSSSKVVLTGNPIRREVFKIQENELTSELDNSVQTLYITGGNQGAHEINKRIFDFLPHILQECNVIHQTGNSTVTNDYRNALDIKDSLVENLKRRYFPVEYVGLKEIGSVFDKADLVLSRSGANSVSELLALGKLSILIPIPWSSGDEQTKNAMLLEETGLGFIIQQKENLSAKQIYQTILLGLTQAKIKKGFNGKDIEACRELAKRKVILDAPQKVVDIVENLI